MPSGLDLHVGCQWTLGHYCLAEFGEGFVLLILAVRSAVLRVSCRQGGRGLCKVIGGTSRRFLIRGLCDVRVVGLPNRLVWLTYGKHSVTDMRANYVNVVIYSCPRLHLAGANNEVLNHVFRLLCLTTMAHSTNTSAELLNAIHLVQLSQLPRSIADLASQLAARTGN